MQKRDFLRASGALAASSLWPFAVLAQSAGDASATASSSTVLAAWHQDSSATQPAGEFVGLFALDWQAARPLMGAGLCLAAAGIALAYSLPHWPLLGSRVDRRLHAAGAQVAFRFNSFIALALIERVAGPAGLPLLALLIGLLVMLAGN